MHLTDWQPIQFELPENERSLWQALFRLRELVLPELEKARQSKLIGKALEAKVLLKCDADLVRVVSPNQDALRELLNVSQLTVEQGTSGTTEIVVSQADGQKCERCWHWEMDVGTTAEHPTICRRCVQAIRCA